MPVKTRAAGAKPRTRLRPAHSAWELQARAAARAALRGQIAGIELTPAPPAARLQSSGSRAEILPGCERAWLERAFQADLSEIRIRRDSSAAQLVRESRADAFTTGSEIYFAPGKFAPGTSVGRELLAHEVAHALQQTGVQDERGRWRATARFGQEAAQAGGSPPPDPPPNIWPELRRIHLEAADGDAGFATFADRVGEIIGGEVLLGRPNAGGRKLEERVLDGRYDNPRLRTRTRALVFDVLKFQNLFDGAEHLVEISPQLQTVGGWPPFLTEMETRHGSDWLIGVFQGDHAHPRMQEWVNRLVNAWRIGLLRSLGDPPRLPGLEKALTDTEAELNETAHLGRNEREYEALKWLNDRDQNRVDAILNSRQANLLQWRSDHPGEADPSAFFLQTSVADALATEAEAQATTYTGPAESLMRDYYSAVVEAIGQTKGELQAATTAVLALEARFEREDLISHLEGPFETDPKLERERSVRSLHRALTSQARELLELLRLPSGQDRSIENLLPSADQLTERSAAAAAALNASATALQSRSVEVAGEETLDEVLLSGLLFLRAWVEGLQWFLRQGVSAPRGEDERLEYRIMIARIFGMLAVRMGWQDLAGRVRPTLVAEDFNFSYLILLSDWEKEPDVPLANLPFDLRGIVNYEVMGTDASGTPVPVDTPLPISGSALYYLFQLTQIQRLQEAAEMEIGRVRGATGEQALPDFAGVVEAGRAFTRPQRWRIPPGRYRFVRLPGETETPGDLVWRHPFTRAKAASDPEWTAAWLKLNPEGETRRLIMWVIPPITDVNNPTRMIDIIKRRAAAGTAEDRALNEMVVAALGREATSDLEWLITLGQAAASPDAVAQFERRIVDLLEAERTAAQQPLAPRFRLLNGLARKALVDLIRPRIASYGSDDITNWDVPLQVVELVRRWASWIQPVEEQRAQMAALYLALAQDLDSAFEYEDRADVISSYYEVVMSALENSTGEMIPVFEKILLPGAGLPPELVQGVPREELGWFSRRRPFLERIRDRFEEKMRASQERFGFEGYGNALHSMVFATPVETGEANGFVVAIRPRNLGRPGPTPVPPMPTSPIYYEIVEINKPFRFHPAQGTEGTASYRPPILKSMVETESSVGGVIPLGSSMEPGEPIPPSSDVILTILYALDGGEGHEETVQIRADDYEWLTLLSAVVDERAFSLGMQHTAELIEAAAELAVDLAELVPGVGQGIAVTRILIAVTDFVVNELPIWRDKLMNEPAQFVQEIADSLDPSNLNFEKVWGFLILPSGANPFAHYLPATTRRRASTSASRRAGKLGRLVAAVQAIRRRFGESFGRIRQSMQGPLLSAQATVASRPALQKLFHNLPNYYIRAEEAVAALPTDRLADLFENPSEASAAISGDVGESLGEMLAGLSEIELPQEVIPLDLAVEILLMKVLDRFGAKGRIVRRVLEATGAITEASGMIADGLRGSAVDPNNLWREFVLPPLEKRFIALRDELVDEIYDLLNQILPPLGVPALTRPTDLPAVEVQATEPFPETDLLPAGELSRGTRWTPSVRPSLSGGRRMDLPLRRSFESRFGHDFSHVRVHDDAASRSMTDQAGATALTSGSHIYFGTGLQPSSPHFTRVLGHELAHVLQQTGPRVRGAPHSGEPIRGEPRRGVHFEPHREMAANRMAEAANRFVRPVTVEGEGGAGLAPSVTSTVFSILGVLSGKEFQTKFDEQVAQEGLRTGADPPGLAQAETIWREAKGALSKMPHGNSARPFRSDEVRDAVTTYVGTTHANSITNAVRPLAALSQNRIRGAARTPRPAGTPPPTELSPRRFTNLLQQFIFSRAGVSLHISLKRGTAKFSSVGIRAIHLGFVDPHAGLWTQLKANTTSHMTTSPMPGWTPLTDTDWTQIRAQIAGTAPDPAIFALTEYRLSNSFITEFIDRRTAAASLSVPDWATYTDPALTVAGQGLRVGTHGELTGLHVTNRESHHIPQFLLIDYFNNDSSTKLFTNANERLPGFEPAASDSPTSFDGGGTTLDFAPLLQGTRGDTMPAVLLHEETHQRGNLHLNREPNWQNADETEGTTNQSNTLNRVFKEAVRQNLGLPAATPYTDTVQAARDDEPKSKPLILEAIKATYRFMYEERMTPPLKTALQDLEIPFYLRAAAKQHAAGGGALPATFRPDQKGLNRVLTAVETKNEQVMSAFRA